MARVLVVDDEPSFRFFLKALFETAGHQAVTARNASEGLARMREAPAALITLDVMMPEHGGLEMYRALKAHEEWKNIPVIMLSGVKSDTYAHALALSGLAGEALPKPFAYVEKPPQPEQLLKLARSAMREGPA